MVIKDGIIILADLETMEDVINIVRKMGCKTIGDLTRLPRSLYPKSQLGYR